MITVLQRKRQPRPSPLQDQCHLSRNVVLTQNSVRERWLVERNQQVTLQAEGAGFTISHEGKALDNGSLGSTVRVMGSDGKMLGAQVVGQNALRLRY